MNPMTSCDTRVVYRLTVTSRTPGGIQTQRNHNADSFAMLLDKAHSEANKRDTARIEIWARLEEWRR